MPPAFVQQQHIYGEVLKAEGHIYLWLKHILGNQEGEAYSFPTLHLGEFRTVQACPFPFLLHLSFPFVFSFSTLYLTPMSYLPDSWFIVIRCKGEPDLERCVALGGGSVVLHRRTLRFALLSCHTDIIWHSYLPHIRQNGWSHYHSAGGIQEE